MLKPLFAGLLLPLAGTLAAAAAETDGAALAKKECATCHGSEGRSVSPSFPRLAGQQAEYIETALKGFRDKSRADRGGQAFMWGMAAQLSDATIKELATYYAAQKPAADEGSEAAELAKGQKLFQEGNEATGVPACQACHGEKAEGQGAVPRLAGQHRDYLEREIREFVSTSRANEIMHENTKNMSSEEITAVTAYLSTLSSSGTAKN
jgi:cbb3-type cytochrome c oxidase subunit III